MDPLLQDLQNALESFNAHPSEQGLHAIDYAVDMYSQVYFEDPPSDWMDAVDAAHAKVSFTPTVSPGGTPSIFSAQGIRMGSIVLPWAGALAILLFVGGAWYFSQPRQRT